MPNEKKIKKQLKIFDTQSFGIIDTIFEWCPNCNKEVEIPAVMGRHTCPSCGAKILSCSICHDEDTDCSRCEEILHKYGVRDVE